MTTSEQTEHSHSEHPHKLFSLLADPHGWVLLRALANGDQRLHELARDTGVAAEEMSKRLPLLRELGLITERQSDVNPNETFYRFDITAFRRQYQEAGETIHPAVKAEDVVIGNLPAEPVRILFLCTGNSARSQMAEGLMRHLSQGKVEVASAGTKPSRVHPVAIQTMDKMGVDIRSQESTHMSQYEGQTFDYVITVCDLQNESCPIFPDAPKRLHWSFPDPAAEPEGEVQERAFATVATHLRAMIRHFLIMIERQTPR